MYLGKLKTSSNVAWHRPMSETFRHEEELMQKSARELESATDPLEKLRLLCLARGASGILGFGRMFRAMDEDGSKRLNRDQFLNGIKETGLELSHEDAMGVFDKFEPENSGYINLDVFLDHMCPRICESRRAIVEQAFKKLDKTGDGVITVSDIRRAYCVTSNPREHQCAAGCEDYEVLMKAIRDELNRAGVHHRNKADCVRSARHYKDFSYAKFSDERYMSGEESADIILDTFLANFESDEQVEGKVTLEEFMNYYSSISLAIDNDSFFDLMMRQTYKL